MSTPPYIPALEFTPALREDAVNVMRRLVGHYQSGTTDQAPEQYIEPVSNYSEPEIWRREVQAIHRTGPLPVALSASSGRGATRRSRSSGRR